MKVKIMFVGLIIFIMTIGLIFISCGVNCSKDGACYYPGINNGGVRDATLCDYGTCRANKAVNGIPSGRCDCG